MMEFECFCFGRAAAGRASLVGAALCAMLGLACVLLTAKDLLHLRLSCKRFNIRCIVAPSVAGRGGSAAPEMLCIVEDGARGCPAGCSEQERGRVPRLSFESWLGLMHEVALLRWRSVVGRMPVSRTLSERGAVATRNVGGGVVTAATTAVSGRCATSRSSQ